MTEKELEEIKESYINHLKSYMSETGGLFPHLSIFADHINKEEDKPAIIHIPIPNKFMSNDDSKDVFVEEVMPEIIVEVKKEFIPFGIAWAAEAWMRTADKDFNIENYKSLPKQEVVFVSIETDYSCDTIIYKVNRVGKQVNSEGELTDKIELEELKISERPQETAGRFSGLYKKLIKNEKTN